MQPWFYWMILAVDLMCHTCCSQQHPSRSWRKAGGLHCLQGLQGLYLPRFKTKERTPSQQQRYQLFQGWGLVQVWSRIPGMLHFALTGRRRLPVIGYTSQQSCWLIGYQGNWQRVLSHCPLKSYHGEDIMI